MTTFTLGLGARGRMAFSPGYLTDPSGDYYAVKNGIIANPPSTCSWQSSGSGACDWPIPDVLGTPENIDDLWHTAVNGRGTYYSATDPTSLATGIYSALNGIKTLSGSSAAATTSNPNVTTGDNSVFSSTFMTTEWTSELINQPLDLSTATLPVYNPKDPTTYTWAAQALLDAKTASSRTVYTSNGTGSPSLIAFTAANFGSSSHFNTPKISALSQFCASGSGCLSAASQTSAAGANLVDYLRGDRTHEGAVNPTNSPNAYYRQRNHVLGDIVNSEAVYVKGSLYQYLDPGFSAYLNTIASRQAMVYVGANDGMVHAFYAADNGDSSIDGGTEAWAFIPSAVLPNLYKLADQNYANLHQYYVDATPVASDVCTRQCSDTTNAVWKTILVGGLNAGGRSYYALDITNPTSPSLLWEFTDTNLGYSFGNPIITKLNNGTWVVMVTSGYNNVSPGDGVGRLYVLNAADGTIINQTSTGVGSATTPSGLANINSWVENSMVDNTSIRTYGGDVLGNLWRFNLNATGGDYRIQLLVNLKDSNNPANPQPITARPELGKVSGKAAVFVGPGKFLGTSDLANTNQQSFYAVKDTVASSVTTSALWSDPRSSTCSSSTTTNCFVKQTITNGICPTGSTVCSAGQKIRTNSNNVVDFSNDNGWYFDLPDSGERSNTNPSLMLGSLVFTSNTPSLSACTVGGYSYLYMLDYRTGAAIPTTVSSSGSTSGSPTANTVTATMLGNAIATRPEEVYLPNGIFAAETRLSNGTTVTTIIPISATSTSTRRISWRELRSD